MIGEKTLELLKQVLADSSYTVAICGSGMMEEGGILGLKQEGRAYEIEQKYSESPEELFHISCLSRRPERFYEFYREEILKKIPDMTRLSGRWPGWRKRTSFSVLLPPIFSICRNRWAAGM